MRRFKEITQKLAVFSFPRLQELVTLFDILQREEISFEEVKEFIVTSIENHRLNQARFKQMSEERDKLWNKNTRKCPNCEKPLMARRVGTPKGRANVRGYTCQWYCQEENCDFEEYTHEDFQEIYKKIMSRR